MSHPEIRPVILPALANVPRWTVCSDMPTSNSPAKQSVLARRQPGTKSKPARAASAANKIVAEIHEALLARRFHAGDFLGTESTLAEHFGAGRSPTRDALRSLEAMGIIDIRVGLGGGVYVAQGNPDLFAEVLGIQLTLMGVTTGELLYAIWAVEEMAVELAVDHRTDGDLAVFAEILQDLSKLLKKPAEFVLRSMDFHAALVDACHNRALIAQARMLRHVVFKHYSETVTAQAAQDVFSSLEKLAGQIKARARTGARRQLVAHYHQARQFMLEAQPQSGRAHRS